MGFIREHEPQVYALMRIVTASSSCGTAAEGRRVSADAAMPQEPPAFIIWTAGRSSSSAAFS
jgi:hypothetical protein